MRRVYAPGGSWGIVVLAFAAPGVKALRASSAALRPCGCPPARFGSLAAMRRRRASRLRHNFLFTPVRYQSQAKDQTALRLRLKEVAAVRIRFGYRRLTVLLRREGWKVNAKRIYRLYRQERLAVRIRKRSKGVSQARVLGPPADGVNQLCETS